MSWGGRQVAALRALVVATHGYTCWICGLPINPMLRWPHSASLSIDHVHRRTDGGTNDLDNLRPAHLACNCGRGTRRPDRPARSMRVGRDFSGTFTPGNPAHLPNLSQVSKKSGRTWNHKGQ